MPIHISYAGFPCSHGKVQQVVLITDEGKSYGMASCPNSGTFFRVPEESVLESYAKRSDSPPQQVEIDGTTLRNSYPDLFEFFRTAGPGETIPKAHTKELTSFLGLDI